MNPIRHSIFVMGVVLFVAGCGDSRQAVKTFPTAPGDFLSNRVQAAPDYPGKIAASEVCIRGLYPRPSNASDPHNTLDAIRGFHATRLEWTYGLTSEFVEKARALGVSVSGVTSSSTGKFHTAAPDQGRKCSLLDLHLQPVTAPWMRTWETPGLWMCINNTPAREASLAAGKELVDLGVRDIQRDDPAANEIATTWGACFCPYCMEGFRGWLKKNISSEKLRALGVEEIESFDYRQYLLARNAPAGDALRSYDGGELLDFFRRFQEESTIAYHKWWREEINRHAGRHVPVSSNNAGKDFTSVYQPFDFWIGELNAKHTTPEFIHDLARQVARLGKGQILTMPLRHSTDVTPDWKCDIRNVIATTYAVGLHMEAPWDTYLPTPEAARYFGKPEEFADLYAMARASATLLDGYEDAAASGATVRDERWPDEAPVAALFPFLSHRVAFLRAKPSDPRAPVAVHLVDWSRSPKPFQISLRPEWIFNGQPFRAVLITPRPYDKAAHDRAFASKDYSGLVERRELASGHVTTLDIPALSPWGIISLEPLPSGEIAPAPWAPSVYSNDREIVLSCATANAVIRYTLDGSEPGADSPAYATPIPLPGQPSMLRTRAFSGTSASAETRIDLAQPEGDIMIDRQILKNAEFREGLKNWQVVISPDCRDGTAVSASVEAAPSTPDRRSASLSIKSTTATKPYHLRLIQTVPLPKDAKVGLSGMVETNREATIRVGLQGKNPPHLWVCMETFTLKPGEPLPFNITSRVDDPLEAQLQIDLGLCPAGTEIRLSDPCVWANRF